MKRQKLWIAFRLYLWFIEHSYALNHESNRSVVNCFQIVSLTYWTQPSGEKITEREGCELLSDCIFDLLNTATANGLSLSIQLWIAFRLYLWLIEHSLIRPFQMLLQVVNCFQIVSLTYWTQLTLSSSLLFSSCELLSDCIFDLLNTARWDERWSYIKLWIAFRLYLWLIEHSIPWIIMLIFNFLSQ